MIERETPNPKTDFHCDLHGWWNPLRASGCPTCVSEARRKIRQLERELAAANERAEGVRKVLMDCRGALNSCNPTERALIHTIDAALNAGQEDKHESD